MLIHFIPWLSCNFSCDFCSFTGFKNKEHIVPDSVVRAFFTYLDSSFIHKKKIISLSGGEPFLPGEQYKKMISRISREAESRGIPLRMNTNGYYLNSSLPELWNMNIESIQIHIDFRRTPFYNDNSVPDTSDYFTQLTAGIGTSLESEISKVRRQPFVRHCGPR